MKTEMMMLTPKLRFPEFHTTWGTTRLDAIAKPITERAGSKSITPFTVVTGVGLISQQARFGRTIAGSAFRNYYVLRKDDFAYNKSATKAYPQGYIARFRGEEGAVPNSIFTCFRVDRNLVAPEYLDYLFAGNLHGRWLKRFIEVSARAHGSLSVGDADLMSLPVPIPEGPSSRSEQHRIAECLKSLDEWIAAERRKLAALRAHKTGLMQLLFPRRGETRPRLRFPEFRDGPDWTRKAMRNVTSAFLDGDWIESKDQSPAGVRLIQTGNIGVGTFMPKEDSARYVSEDTVARLNCTEIFPDDCLIARLPDPLGRSCLVPDIGRRMITAVDCTIARFDPGEVVPYFFVSYSQTDEYLNEVAALSSGSTRTRISRAHLANLTIPLPALAEQQRIVACLSSLDALVAAQTQRLDGLRIHKQGLMQQIFPSPEGL